MDALTLTACAQNQRNAARWYAKAREWQAAAAAGGLILPAAVPMTVPCCAFGSQDQQTAAFLSRADRVMRGLEA